MTVSRTITIGLLATLMMAAALALTGCNGFPWYNNYHGIVLDAKTEQPIPGVEIKGYYVHFHMFHAKHRGVLGFVTEMSSSTTGKNGTFILSLRGRDRIVVADKPGYERTEHMLPLWPKGKNIRIRLEPSNPE